MTLYIVTIYVECVMCICRPLRFGSSNRTCLWRMTENDLFSGLCVHCRWQCLLSFNFRAVLYLQLLVHVFRITYCPGATVLSSAETVCTEVVPDGVRHNISDDLNIVLLWEYRYIDRNPNHIPNRTVPGVQVSRHTLLFIGQSCLHTTCKRMCMNGGPSVLFGNYASSWLRAQLCVRWLQIRTAGRNVSWTE